MFKINEKIITKRESKLFNQFSMILYAVSGAITYKRLQYLDGLQNTSDKFEKALSDLSAGIFEDCKNTVCLTHLERMNNWEIVTDSDNLTDINAIQDTLDVLEGKKNRLLNLLYEMETDHIINLAVLDGEEKEQEKTEFYNKKRRIKKEIANIHIEIYELCNKILKKITLQYLDLEVTEAMVNAHLKNDKITRKIFKSWTADKQKEYINNITPKSQTRLLCNARLQKTFEQASQESSLEDYNESHTEKVYTDKEIENLTTDELIFKRFNGFIETLKNDTVKKVFLDYYTLKCNEIEGIVPMLASKHKLTEKQINTILKRVSALGRKWAIENIEKHKSFQYYPKNNKDCSYINVFKSDF